MIRIPVLFAETICICPPLNVNTVKKIIVTNISMIAVIKDSRSFSGNPLAKEKKTLTP